MKKKYFITETLKQHSSFGDLDWKWIAYENISIYTVFSYAPELEFKKKII